MILKLFDVAHLTRVSPLSFRWPRPKHPVALSGVFVCPPNFRIKVPHHNVFAFPGSYQWCCRSCLSLHLSEMSLAHLNDLQLVSVCYASLVLLSFNFLFTRKPTPACPLFADSEWYSRWPVWRVVKLSYILRTSPSSITSHFMVFCYQFLHVFIF